MSRRYNAIRALEAAARNERAAWEAFAAIPPRTRDDVATEPVKGDRVGDTEVWHVHTDGFVSYGTATRSYSADPHTWAHVARHSTVSPVPTPLAAAKRAVWERAATRLESARAAVASLPPKGHKRRKDGTCYPVQGPRENAARAAGRDAFRRAAGRAAATLAVILAFILFFTSACN